MNVPYKYRGLLSLMLLAFVLPGAVWRFALCDSFGVWRECRRLAAHLATSPAVEPTNRDAAFPTAPELILSGLLLDSLRHASTDRILVAGYEPLMTLRESGIAVHSARLTLMGDFEDLLRLVATLECTLPQCRLRSMTWQTASDGRARRRPLALTLYIQQIVLNE